MATWWRGSRKSRRSARAGSTGDTWCWSRKCFTTFRATDAASKPTRWKNLRRKGNWLRSGTKDFGNAWTRCETRGSSKHCGRAAKRHGRCGNNDKWNEWDERDGSLPGTFGFFDRAHGIQRLMARAVARSAGREGERLCARSSDGPEQFRKLRDRRFARSKCGWRCARRGEIAPRDGILRAGDRVSHGGANAGAAELHGRARDF